MQQARGRAIWLGIGIALALTACEPGGDLPVLTSQISDTADYRLSADDQVRVTTFGEQNLSGEFGIDSSGFIALPLAGPLQAEGLTTRALADEIATTLKTKRLLADPNVVVEVAKYRPVFVLGEVQHPGPFPYQPRMTMLNAVALAGGFTPRAVKSRAEVVRTDSKATLRGRLEPLTIVQPGDIVTVLERNF